MAITGEEIEKRQQLQQIDNDAVRAAETGEWDKAIELGRKLPKNWDIWQRLPSVEGGMPESAIKRILPIAGRDSNFIYELVTNLRPDISTSTLHEINKHPMGYIEGKELKKHPNWQHTPETLENVLPGKFWESYEYSVKPQHFATIKSMFTGQPEKITDHRGNTGSSHESHMAHTPGGQPYTEETHPDIMSDMSSRDPTVHAEKSYALRNTIPHLKGYAKKVQEAISRDPDIKMRYFGGKPHILLHRGVGGDYGKAIKDSLNHNQETNEIDNKTVNIPTAHLTSWSTDIGMAKRFASSRGNHHGGHGMVVSAWHPLESVLHSGFHDAYPNQQHAHEDESEIVVGHPNAKTKIKAKDIRFVSDNGEMSLPVLRQRQEKLKKTDMSYQEGGHQAPDSESGAPMHNLVGTYQEDIYGANGAHYYGHGVPYDRESIGVISAARGKPKHRVKIYRAVPHVPSSEEKISDLEKQKAHIQKYGKVPPGVSTGKNKSDYYEDISNEIDNLKANPHEGAKYSINPGDWVTTSRQYAHEHGQGALNGKYRVVSKTVPAEHLFTDGNSIHEWGYSPPELKKSENIYWLVWVDGNRDAHKASMENGKYKLDDGRIVSPENIKRVYMLEDTKRAGPNSNTADLAKSDKKIPKSQQVLNQLGEQGVAPPEFNKITLSKLYRAYKNTPHRPESLLLKYAVHRLENADKYGKSANVDKKLDDDFLKLHQRGGASSKNGHITANDLKAGIANNPSILKSLVIHKQKLNRMISNIPGAIHNINGEPHVILTRGLDVEKENRGPDHALASYADQPHTGFGNHMHHQYVPLENIWYSFDHGPKSASSENHGPENEFLVSPHEIKYSEIPSYQIAERDSHKLTTSPKHNTITALRSPNATAEHIGRALGDSDEYVRLNAIKHPNATAEHISRALGDSDRYVKQEAAKRQKELSEKLASSEKTSLFELLKKTKSLVNTSGYKFIVHRLPSGGVHIRAYHPSIHWGANFVSEAPNGVHSNMATQALLHDNFFEKYGEDFSVPYEDTNIKNNTVYGGLVGSVTVNHEGEVGGSHVYPSHRRKGIASHLYALAEKELGKKLTPSAAQSKYAKLLWSKPDRQFGKLEKAEYPPAKHGEIHPEKGYVAKRHTDGRLVWYADPKKATDTDKHIAGHKDVLLSRYPEQYRPLISSLVDKTLSLHTRHAIVAKDARGGADVIRARHLKALMDKTPGVRLELHSPTSLTFHIDERHGAETRPSAVKFNMLQDSPKVSTVNTDKVIKENENGLQNLNKSATNRRGRDSSGRVSGQEARKNDKRGVLRLLQILSSGSNGKRAGGDRITGKTRPKHVASIAVIDGGNILMGRRNDSGRFTLPGGHLEGNETPYAGAARELFEEAGVKAKNLHYLGAEMISCEDGNKRIIHAFVMYGKPKTTGKHDPDEECDKWGWVPFKNGLPENVKNNLHSPKNVVLKKLKILG